MAMKAGLEIHPRHSLAGRGVYLLDDHEIVRRGLRQLLGSDGLGIAGESGSARVAVRRTPALRPALVIVDDDLPDGSGAEVCRAIAAADPVIRCVLMTDDCNEAVLIDSILAGAWGCLSKQDDGGEQLRLIRRALAGHTAYSGRFQAALLAPFALPGPQRLDKRLLSLTRQEMNAAIGLGKGLSNRQISKEMSLAEKTVKNLVSSVLTKLGMARRTQAAVLITRALNPFRRSRRRRLPVQPLPGSDRRGHGSTAALHQRVPRGAPNRRTAGKGRRAACRRTYLGPDRPAGTPPAAKPDLRIRDPTNGIPGSGKLVICHPPKRA